MSAGERPGVAVVGGRGNLTPREEQRLLDAAQLEADRERVRRQPHPDFPAKLGYDERDTNGGLVFDHQPTSEEYEAAKFGGEVVVLSDRKRDREAARHSGGHVLHVVARTN